MDRPTIISQIGATGARVEYRAPDIPAGAFGQFSGLDSLGRSIGEVGNALAHERSQKAQQANVVRKATNKIILHEVSAEHARLLSGVQEKYLSIPEDRRHPDQLKSLIAEQSKGIISSLSKRRSDMGLSGDDPEMVAEVRSDFEKQAIGMYDASFKVYANTLSNKAKTITFGQIDQSFKVGSLAHDKVGFLESVEQAHSLIKYDEVLGSDDRLKATEKAKGMFVDSVRYRMGLGEMHSDTELADYINRGFIDAGGAHTLRVYRDSIDAGTEEGQRKLRSDAAAVVANAATNTPSAVANSLKSILPKLKIPSQQAEYVKKAVDAATLQRLEKHAGQSFTMTTGRNVLDVDTITNTYGAEAEHYKELNIDPSFFSSELTTADIERYQQTINSKFSGVIQHISAGYIVDEASKFDPTVQMRIAENKQIQDPEARDRHWTEAVIPALDEFANHHAIEPGLRNFENPRHFEVLQNLDDNLRSGSASEGNFIDVLSSVPHSVIRQYVARNKGSASNILLQSYLAVDRQNPGEIHEANKKSLIDIFRAQVWAKSQEGQTYIKNQMGVRNLFERQLLVTKEDGEGPADFTPSDTGTPSTKELKLQGDGVSRKLSTAFPDDGSAWNESIVAQAMFLYGTRQLPFNDALKESVRSHTRNMAFVRKRGSASSDDSWVAFPRNAFATDWSNPLDGLVGGEPGDGSFGQMDSPTDRGEYLGAAIDLPFWKAINKETIPQIGTQRDLWEIDIGNISGMAAHGTLWWTLGANRQIGFNGLTLDAFPNYTKEMLEAKDQIERVRKSAQDQLTQAPIYVKMPRGELVPAVDTLRNQLRERFERAGGLRSTGKRVYDAMRFLPTDSTAQATILALARMEGLVETVVDPETGDVSWALASADPSPKGPGAGSKRARAYPLVYAEDHPAKAPKIPYSDVVLIAKDARQSDRLFSNTARSMYNMLGLSDRAKKAREERLDELKQGMEDNEARLKATKGLPGVPMDNMGN